MYHFSTLSWRTRDLLLLSGRRKWARKFPTKCSPRPSGNLSIHAARGTEGNSEGNLKTNGHNLLSLILDEAKCFFFCALKYFSCLSRLLRNVVASKRNRKTKNTRANGSLGSKKGGHGQVPLFSLALMLDKWESFAKFLFCQRSVAFTFMDKVSPF